MSRAVVFWEYGDPDVLRVVDVESPTPGPGEVRVRVRAAGVQPFDTNFRAGRLDWARARFPQRLGTEVAGVVDAVGPDVAGLAVGDEVLGAVSGGYADHVLARPDHLARKPADMPWAEAGGLAASGRTAVYVLRQLDVGAGDTLLVHAAAGGVGSMAVQVARARGAAVIGTASPRNHDHLTSLGATPVAYGDGLVERVRAVAPAGVDAALDAAGTEEAARASLELVGDQQRVVTIVGDSPAERLGIRMVSAQPTEEMLAELVDLYETGRLRVSVYRTFPLDRAADAHREVEARHVRGKVVLLTD
ncbi:MAG: NADP-dependent oxidoreductase [Streptosporangiales bacterium]|nr:NADP-dependent oxidoreductase [Streptosporangiales bacterium]MBO0891740.1 NADP-dependent oxidoreductase [Acidothermales bacterium]